MLDALTIDSFSPLLHEAFRLTLSEGATLEFELVEVAPLGMVSSSGRAGDRQPFSLLFRGPMETVLPQRIYSLSHPGLGELEIFIVPLGPKEGGMIYQAIFT